VFDWGVLISFIILIWAKEELRKSKMIHTVSLLRGRAKLITIKKWLWIFNPWSLSLDSYIPVWGICMTLSQLCPPLILIKFTTLLRLLYPHSKRITNTTSVSITRRCNNIVRLMKNRLYVHMVCVDGGQAERQNVLSCVLDMFWWLFRRNFI
jgi:hypothetical protein